MREFSFSNVKIHNEIELFVVTDLKVKRQIEHLFLENRISYFEKWEEVSFIRRFFWGVEKMRCTFCVNEMQMEKAIKILEDNPALKQRVELVRRRVERTYF